MPGSDSRLPLPKAARLVVRVWLAERGCCCFRAETVTNADAHDVLAYLRQVREDDDTLAQSLTKEFRLDSGRNAFFRTRRDPDPNNPRRKISNVWVWLPESHTETLEDADHFFDGHALPRNEHDISELKFHRVQTADTGPAASNNYGTDLGRTPSAAVWIRRLILVLTALIAVGFFVMRFLRPTATHEPVVTPNKTRPIASTEWNAAGLKYEIRSRLTAAGETNVDELDDTELLQRFVRLFRRPKITDALSPNERESYRRYQDSNAAHPFLSFVDQLPDALPDPVIGPESEKWPDLAEAHLRPLAKTLRNAGVRALAAPPELMHDLLDMLDYPAFFTTWQTTHTGYDKSDPWCENSNTPGLTEWQVEIRKLMLRRYNP